MKQALISFFCRFSYPQRVFASAILKFIDVSTVGGLVDAPCGEGATSWTLSKYRNLKVYGFDISPESIKKAKNNFKRENLSFEVSDVHDAVNSCNNVKYFCIINSLFLLPEPSKLLESVKIKLLPGGRLFVIVPNTENENFKWFQANNPGVNKLVLCESEFQTFFSSAGWELDKVVPIVYARSFRRKDVAFLSIFAPIYLQILNSLQELFGIGKPNYFLLVLKTND
jgi:trans-aconitate methyltransferase